MGAFSVSKMCFGAHFSDLNTFYMITRYVVSLILHVAPEHQQSSEVRKVLLFWRRRRH